MSNETPKEESPKDNKVVEEDPKKKYRQKFRKEWLRREPFVGWLREVPGDCTKAYCRLCKCTIAAKYYDIVKHSETKKHVNAASITNSMGFLDDDDDDYSEFCLSPQKFGRSTLQPSSGEQSNRKNWISMLQRPAADQQSKKKDWVSILRPSSGAQSVSKELVSILQRASDVQPKKGDPSTSKFKKPRRKSSKYEENEDALSLSYMKLQEPQDEYDKVGAAWACELRKMDPEQQVFAKKAINDVLFEGRLGTLDRNSGILFSPPPKMHNTDFSYTEPVPPQANVPSPQGNVLPPHDYVSPPHGYNPPHGYAPPPHGNVPPSHWQNFSQYDQRWLKQES